MRKISLVLALLLAAPLLAADWKKFDSGRFSILMPETPKPATNSQWVAADPQGRAYNATSGFLTDAPADPRNYFDQTVQTALEGTHGHLLYKKYLKMQGLPACEFKLTDGVHVVGGRLVLDKAWVYILEFATDTKTFDASLMKRFFESFHINEPGK